MGRMMTVNEEMNQDMGLYQHAVAAAMEVFQMTNQISLEEKYSYSLVHQIRRSSSSVCVNIADALEMPRSGDDFIARLSEARREACETQVWLEFAVLYQHIDEVRGKKLDAHYATIISQLDLMIDNAKQWAGVAFLNSTAVMHGDHVAIYA